MKNLFGDIAETAIERLKCFEESALEKSADGYYVAYSGGKDSDVILDLVRRSCVKYTAHHHLTTCDPPEVVYHVRTQPDVEILKPKITMWALIRKKGMPPRRQARYCCEALKENAEQSKNRVIVTGVRWGESTRRSKRRMMEACYRDKTKHYLHPIIDWSDQEVWGHIKTNNIPYCRLYDEGFTRLGCVLCPMTRDVKKQMARWPRIARAWEKAVKSTFHPQKPCKKGTFVFTNPQEYWEWWLDRDAPSRKKDDNQMMFFED